MLPLQNSMPSPNILHNMAVGNPKTFLESMNAKASDLAKTKWSGFTKSLKTESLQKQTAVLLENTKAYFDTLDETTRQQQVGNFDKFAFPLIRAIFPNLIAQEIVSVQPMAGPISLVFYLDFLFGTSKGQFQAGQSAFDSMSGPVENPTYSSEDIDLEPIATADGVATIFNVNLAFTPVQPNTVQVVAAGVQGFDDGAGNIGGTGIAAGTINYATGAVAITFTAAPALNTVITATYRYDMEANENIPQVDLQLTSSPVVARHRKLRTRWSIEAQASLRTLHGLDAQSELAAFTAEEIKFEIDREIINDLFTTALAGNVNWSITTPAGVSFTEHKLSFIDACIELGNFIFQATRRGQANFLVVSVGVANIIESLPTFVAEPGALSTTQSTGVIKIGTLNNRWVVYKDPFLGVNQPEPRVFFGGYKGNSFLDAGYVYAPYLPLYSTPTIYLDDFIGRKGLGTAYGKRVINPRFYATGAIVN